jgi:hypothetical protein
MILSIILQACQSCSAEGVSLCFYCRGGGQAQCKYCRGTGMKAGIPHPAVYTHPMVGHAAFHLPHTQPGPRYFGVSHATVCESTNML